MPPRWWTPRRRRSRLAMGIQGLHAWVKPISQPISLTELKGRTIAVDVSGWLHRGLFACALEVESGQSTDRFLDVTLRCLELFSSHEVRTIVVFDGAVLPQKEERSRNEGGRMGQRQESRQKAIELLEAGRRQEAVGYLAKAASVQPWMAAVLIDELRKRGIPFVVAPYEADPQLAFLVREGHAFAALSDDSDLLPYGCPRTLFKFDEASASAQIVVHDDLRSLEDDKGHHLFSGACEDEWAQWVRVTAGLSIHPSPLGRPSPSSLLYPPRSVLLACSVSYACSLRGVMADSTLSLRSATGGSSRCVSWLGQTTCRASRAWGSRRHTPRCASTRISAAPSPTASQVPPSLAPTSALRTWLRCGKSLRYTAMLSCMIRICDALCLSRRSRTTASAAIWCLRIWAGRSVRRMLSRSAQTASWTRPLFWCVIGRRSQR